MAGLRALRLAAGRALAGPGLWPIALAGFLARGGIILFALPVLVLPSVVGLGTLVGPASITPNGPTAGLVVRITLVAGLALAALIAGTVVAAASEISLVQAGQLGADPSEHPPAAATVGLLGRVVLIRLLSLVPLAIALAIGLPRLGQITYLELTAPTDLVTPIALRVAAQAPEVVGLIGLAWLVGEAWAGLAVRLVVLRGERVAAAFIGSVVLCLRRPVSIVGVVLVSLALAFVALGLVIVLISWSWEIARSALLGGGGLAGTGLVIASAVLFAACWAIGLGVAGVLATWRSLSLTLTVGEDHRGSIRMSPERATL